MTCTSCNLSDGVAYRIYANSTLTISTSKGKITQIEFTSGKNGTNQTYTNHLVLQNSNGTYDNTTTDQTQQAWTGSSTSVSFNASAQVRLTQIVVTVELDTPEGTVATPTFSPAAGTYNTAQSVEISCSTAGATIYYTTDGTDPTTSSSVYSSAISVASSQTIKAIAAKEDMTNSAVASATYTINIIPIISAANVELAYNATSGSFSATIENSVDGGVLSASTTADWLTVGTVSGTTVPLICDANTALAARSATVTLTYTYNTDQTVTKNVTVTQAGDPSVSGSQDNPYTVAQAISQITGGNTSTVYVHGIISQISSTSVISGGYLTYYISDDGTTTSQLQVYKGKGLNNAGFTAVSDIAVGDVVTIYGPLLYYDNRTPEINTGNYIISLDRTVTCATPTFDVAAGPVTSGTVVTISSSTDGATIYYTTDGSTPTTSSTQGTTVTITSAITLKAIAVKEGCTNSEVASAEYTIASERCATPTFSVPDGTLLGAMTTLTIECTTPGATIYYVMGKGVSDPTTESNVYDPENKPTITISTTVKAIAVADGYLTSEVASASYTLPYLSPSYPTIAHDATSGSISYTITDPQDDGELTATTTADWLTIGEVGEDAVAFTCTANTAEVARTATVTFVYTYNNGTYTREREVTVTQSKFVLDYATLPFNWAGGVKADLQAITGVTAPGLGTDYASNNSPYLVKLDGTGDYIQVKTDSQPGKVTIGVKMIGGGNTSTITVQESADGSTFTDVETLTISGSQNAVLSLETTESFAAETRYVRLLFTKGSNVGVGPITIAQYVAPTPAITPESTIVNLNAALHESEIVNLTYTLIDTNTSAPTVVFCDANGEAATYDWISEVSVADDMLLFTVAANTGNGAPARMAYMKVQGTSTVDGATVSSPIITVTQAAPEYFTITLSDTEGCGVYVFDYNDDDEPLVSNEGSESSVSVLSGTTIGVSFFANNGYFNPSITVTDVNQQNVDLTDDGTGDYFTFVLDRNVIISAEAVEGHTVNFFDEDIENCTIRVYTDPANKETSALVSNDPVAPGTTVYVEATPGEGYGTLTITVLASDTPVEVNYANGVYSFTVDYDVEICATAAVLSQSSYVLTDLADLTENDVFIIVGNNGNGTYALSNDKGTSNAPTAVEVEVTDDDAISTDATNIQWNISGDATNGYTFYPNGDTESWLYCTNTNNGVRVGTNENNVFTFDGEYLWNTATERYVGIYNSSDWRCYTSVNSNITGQYVTFYKLVEDNGKLDPQLAFKLNNEVVTEITADIAGDPFVSPAITFADGFNGTITYTSSNTATATVDEAGIVTLEAVGETTITATFAGNDTYNASTASYVLTVTNPALITIDLAIVRPEGFLRTAEMGMPLGILSLSATNHTTGEAVGAPASVTWSSDNPDVATVDRDGMVTAQGLPGTVTITATFAGDEVYTAASATYEITLKFEPRITEGPFDLRYGTPLTITQSADPADVESNVRSDGALTITSSETRVVTAEDNVITAQAVGQTTVTLATPETDNFWAASTDPITVSVIEPMMPATGTPTSSITTVFTDKNLSNDQGQDWEASIEAYGFETASPSRGVQFGTAKGEFTLTLPNTRTVKTVSMVVSTTGTANANSIAVAVGGTAFGDSYSMPKQNNYTFTFEGESTGTGNIVITVNDANKSVYFKSITVTYEGDYEFAKLNANGYATYSSLYNLDFTDAEANGYSAWAVTALENVEDVITLRFAQINSRVAAGTGVLLKGTPNATVELPIPDADGASLTQNLLDGVVVPKFVLEDNFYMLKGQTFIRMNEGVVPAHKAILSALHMPSVSPAGIKAFNFVFHDTATGLDTVETLTPEQAAEIFDLSGRKLNKATKGINIVNGKKVLRK